MTNRNRTIGSWLAVGLSIATLAACGSGSPEAGRPNVDPTSPTATGPTSTTTSSIPGTTASTPGPTASTTKTAAPTQVPARPASANGLSLAAAESFIRFYTNLLNYSSDTGDTAPLLEASDSGCEGCKLYANYVKLANGKNGGLTGDYRESVKEVSELYRGTNGNIGASAVISVGAYVSKQTANSKPVAAKAATYKRQIALAPEDGRWIMYEMKQAKQ